MTKKPTIRPDFVWPENRDGLSVREIIQRRNAKPIRRAAEKLSAFIGGCVTDEDFKHPQSQHLLSFLLLTRDVLTDPITEAWTIDDILAPITEEVKRRANETRMQKLDAINEAKREAREYAQQRASELWALDTDKKIRIGEMVRMVLSSMPEDRHLQARPEKLESLKDWIRPVAPKYALRGGRPAAKTPGARRPPAISAGIVPS